MAWADGSARVRTRAGEVSVPLDQVIAGKPVPAPPTRRAAAHLALGLEALEDVASDGWRPFEQDWLGVRGQGWRLRAAGGFTGRANSVLAIGDPGLPLPDAVDVASRWYLARGLPPRFSVPWALDVEARADGSRPGPLDDELVSRGYELDTPTLVMTAANREVAAAGLRPGSVPLPADLLMRLDDEPDDAWLAAYHYRGQALPDGARRVLLSAPAQVFVSVRSADGRALAVGRGASSRGWTGVAAMEVDPAHRRRGLARQVLATICAWGCERGDRAAYLQVAETNAPARAAYRAAGFTDHHGYQYRLLPPPPVIMQLRPGARHRHPVPRRRGLTP